MTFKEFQISKNLKNFKIINISKSSKISKKFRNRKIETFKNRPILLRLLMFVCVYVCIYGCMYVYIYVSMYVWIHSSMYVCIYQGLNWRRVGSFFEILSPSALKSWSLIDFSHPHGRQIRGLGLTFWQNNILTKWHFCLPSWFILGTKLLGAKSQIYGVECAVLENFGQFLTNCRLIMQRKSNLGTFKNLFLDTSPESAENLFN